MDLEKSLDITDINRVPKKKIEEPVTNQPIKKNFRYMRDKDREMVSGVFHFHEVPGGLLSFCIKLWKEDSIERYDLLDGHYYTIPLGVAKHLNKNGWYPVHQYTQDANGKTSTKIGQKVRRFSFSNTDFIEIDDLTPVGGIITVEKV